MNDKLKVLTAKQDTLSGNLVAEFKPFSEIPGVRESEMVYDGMVTGGSKEVELEGFDPADYKGLIIDTYSTPV